MVKRFLSSVLILTLLVAGGLAQAQDDTTTSTGPQNTVQFTFFACETNGIIDLTGTMLAGYDIYVQVFDGSLTAGIGTGEPLTDLLRVPVAGDYQVSPTLTYNGGQIVALGQYAYVRVAIALESNPEAVAFEDTAEDYQDTCPEPTYPSVDTTATDVTIDPVTGEEIPVSESGQPAGIYAPDGGVLFLRNAPNPATEPLVQIGARASEAQTDEIGRTNKPGYIFAECDAVPRGRPGRLYDTDNLLVFWSWFARTPAQVQQHIDNAQYEVYFNSEFTPPQTFNNVIRTDIVQREDGNYWVFYFVNLGPDFRPGDYSIGLRVYWNEAITDGYDDFGPGTETEFIENNCTFDIEPNPWGVDVNYRNPVVPLNPPPQN